MHRMWIWENLRILYGGNGGFVVIILRKLRKPNITVVDASGEMADI